MAVFSNRNNNNVLSVLSALILSFTAIFVLQGCGGGGGSDPEPVPDADVSGIYEGTFTESGGGVYDIQGVIHDNRAMFILDEFVSGEANALIYDGTLTISGNDFTSSFKEYNQGETMLTGSAFAITGSVDSNGVITITAASPELGQGTISLTPNTTLYALGADLINIVFGWTSLPMDFFNGDMTLGLFEPAFLDAPAGVFRGNIGSSSSGDTCAINILGDETKGRITIPDASKNTYQVTMTFECDDLTHIELKGTYTGLAYSTGITASDNLIFITTKSDRAIAAVMN